MTSQVTFYDWRPSPFCMKVRAILDHKGIAYRSVNPVGAALLRIHRHGIGKVPAVEFDGGMVVDSTDIAYELERHFPSPPILPATPRERALCHALEDWADESLYFIGLYYRWYDKEGRKPIRSVFGATPAAFLIYRFYLRRILGQLRGQGTLRKTREHVDRDLERHLDAIEALLEPGPFLLGEQPWLCDFALWGQLNYLSRTPHGGKALAGRKAIAAFLERVRGKRAARE
jgi:glutathione S-transferase